VVEVLVELDLRVRPDKVLLELQTQEVVEVLQVHLVVLQLKTMEEKMVVQES
jgi:hypothetical protein